MSTPRQQLGIASTPSRPASQRAVDGAPTGSVSSAPQFTVVGSTAVLLDPASRQILICRRRAIELPGQAGGEPPVLRRPGRGTVLVADGTSLYSIPLSGGKPVTLAHPRAWRPRPSRFVDGWSTQRGRRSRLCGPSLRRGAEASRRSSGSYEISRLIFRVDDGLIVLNDAGNGYVCVDDSTVKKLDDWASVEVKQIENTHHRRRRDTKQQFARNRRPVACPTRSE